MRLTSSTWVEPGPAWRQLLDWKRIRLIEDGLDWRKARWTRFEETRNFDRKP
ncbi:hypothetical protein BDV95DRAFT_579516 [Massariosphaeria phaeospora]|uniref:Uncharacterized protein n=1 Tax=Massariosphaeria phaeospora TaxID=100035 RepID=A0A7C8M679_9PLEO|nr:hypothetical protein BDV95DRAFT_579516 [Massariosphaeria phaeospora]